MEPVRQPSVGMSRFNWDNCPEEVLCQIFTFFSVKEAYTLSLVCKQFRRLAFDDARFASICHKRFPFTCTKKGINDYAEANGWVKTLKLLSGLSIPYHHFDASTSSAIDGDIYVAGNGCSVKAWDLCTGELLYLYKFPYGNLKKILVAIEGSLLIMSCFYHDFEKNTGHSKLYSRDVKVASLSPKLLCEQKDRNILSVAIKNGIVVTGDSEGKIELLGVEAEKSLHIFEAHKGVGVNSVMLEDNFFASAGDDGLIKIWDWQSYECTGTLKGHDGPIKCISGNQKYMASGGHDKMLRLWDLTLGICLHTFPPQEDEIQRVILENNLLLSADHHSVTGRTGFGDPMEVHGAGGHMIRKVNAGEKEPWMNAFLWDINNTQECLRKYCIDSCSFAMQGEVAVLQKDQFQSNPYSFLRQPKKAEVAKSRCLLQ